MYQYAAKEEVAGYKAYCQEVLGRLLKGLEEKCGNLTWIIILS